MAVDPSGETSSATTASRCPSGAAFCDRLGKSQIRTVQSDDAEITEFASDAIATALTTFP